MSDLDDLACFVVVVRHNGFTAAARATGIEKTRLSRRLAALEQRLGVSLLQRNTRGIALTEAGKMFYADSVKVVEGAELAYESVAVLRSEPAGAIRLSSTHALAASCLAPILAGYLALHPKVRVELELSDAGIDIAGQRFDVALRCSPQCGGVQGMVVRTLGAAPRRACCWPAAPSWTCTAARSRPRPCPRCTRWRRRAKCAPARCTGAWWDRTAARAWCRWRPACKPATCRCSWRP